MAINPPQGWTTLSASLAYEDPRAAIAWLERVLGFATRLCVEDAGTIIHSELTFGDAVIMVGSIKRDHVKSPRSVGGANTQSLMLYVSDVEAHHARARAAGGKITMDIATQEYGEDYGTNRSYEVEDPEGHRWWITQRL